MMLLSRKAFHELTRASTRIRSAFFARNNLFIGPALKNNDGMRRIPAGSVFLLNHTPPSQYRPREFRALCMPVEVFIYDGAFTFWF